MKLDLTKESALALAHEAVRRGASAAEVIIRHRTEFSVGVRLGEIETLKQSSDQGLGLRVLIGGKQASVSGSELRRDTVLALIDEAIELARATSPDDTAGLPEQDELATSIQDLDLYDVAIEQLPTEEKIQLALRAERAAKDYSDLIINFDGGGFDSAAGTAILANSLGFAGEYSATSCSLVAVPVAAESGKMQRDYWYDVRRKLSELESPEDIGVMAAKRTLRKLGARPVPIQSVPVVFEPNIARDLVGDIFNAVSGESIFRKSSFLVGQLGERVASRMLTVVDDGAKSGAMGSRPFDGEGLPTRRTKVIDQGVLESYLLNTYTARKLGLRSTGNAGRGLVGAPSVEAGNMYIEPGQHSPEDIIKSVSKGFYVTELIGFGVNIVTGDYSRSASGIWIENGELTFPVQGVTIAGNLKEMLNAIEMIGNDLDFRGSVVSPTLLVGRMTIGA
ncbi:MAG TPA: metallopeptidase TldD-related protein [Blastocatellia bacterium]|nr:metallopeptidase TldD-related protein [Blastocatellia bacterium]